MPGIAFAPVVWKQGRPELTPRMPEVPEENREAEAGRIEQAVETVATRLEHRASQATGVASEVLSATASLCRDRGWRRAAVKNVKRGTAAPQAVSAAIAQFITQYRQKHGSSVVTVYLPQYIVGHWWESVLHNRRARRIAQQLMLVHGVQITLVPWLLDSSEVIYGRRSRPLPGDDRAGRITSYGLVAHTDDDDEA